MSSPLFPIKQTVKIVALGALLAGMLWAAKGPPRSDGDQPEIVITEVEVAHQYARWEKMWGRPPSAEELKKAMDGYVRNETLYREALARGMDREDPRVRKFYEAPEGEYDILLTSMEVGSAWNMVYPDFTTVLVRGGALKKELVYAASPENAQLIRKLNDWLRLQRSNGTMTRLYDYWVPAFLAHRTRSPETSSVLTRRAALRSDDFVL